jgi:serine protease
MLYIIYIFLTILNIIHCAPEYILRERTPGKNLQKLSILTNSEKINGRAKIENVEYLFVSTLSNEEKASLSKDYIIEENHRATINNPTVKFTWSWHLDRIDQKTLPLSLTQFKINHNTSNVDMYILDTGIDIYHPEFSNNKITWGANFMDDINRDCHGHGTHVASLAGGKELGVAKNVNLIAVKVLGCEGWGSYSAIISAVEWVMAQAKVTKRTSIINMSLGGPVSEALNSAVRAAKKSGVHVVVAAGNEDDLACNHSPASAKEIITVAASDSSDNRASFSNHGSCVDMYAPGVNVAGAWPNNQYKSISGTSMASPVAAGILAVYLSKYGSKTGIKMFFGNLTNKVIKNNKPKTINKLVYI